MDEVQLDNRRIALANATTLVAQGFTEDPVDLAKRMLHFLEPADDDGQR